MKTLIATMLTLLMTSMFSAHAEEIDGWGLTIVKADDLIYIPVNFVQKKICTEVGLAWTKADGTLEGFVCSEAPIFAEGFGPDGEGS